jgi:hypothetical protein
VLAAQYRLEHNHGRPHSSLGYRTPAEFGAEQPAGPSAPAYASEGAPANVASAPGGAPAFDHPPRMGGVTATLS